MLRTRLLCHANAFTRLSGTRSQAPRPSPIFISAFDSASSPASAAWSHRHGICSARLRYVSPLLLVSRVAGPEVSKRPSGPAENARSLASKPSSRSKTKHSPKRTKKRSDETETAPRTPAYIETLIQLRDAITDGQIDAMTDGYLAIRGTLRLGGDDVGAMAQALHTALRRRRPDATGKRDLTDLLTLADILVADVQEGRLPPNHSAHLHLLAFYKEAQHFDKGLDLWRWLIDQDESYVSPAVYGAAIELLAVQGRPAEETEHLYVQALKRFPGSFNEYHLSHDAVLPDRNQPFNVTGIPVTLLQGILTARILRGDSKNAYLALDTALRLFPTQLPSRFFTLFVEERPVTEAYKVFMMACRSGTTVGPDCLKALLTKLRHVSVVDPVRQASVLRSLLTASYAFAASGASLTNNHLTELVIAITSIMRHPTISALPKENMNQLADHVLLAVSRLFDIWALQGSRPGIAAFNSIITNVAGMGKRNDVMETCLADMEALGLEPNAVTRRSLLMAAGNIGDGELVKSAWDDLFDFRQTTRTRVDLADWQTLAKAAKAAGEEDFVRQLLVEAGSTIDPHLSSRVEGMLQGSTKVFPERMTGSLEDVKQLVAALLRDTIFMEGQLQDARFRNFYEDPLPMSLGGTQIPQSATEEQMRAIYDELTTDVSLKHEQPIQMSEPTSTVSQADVELPLSGHDTASAQLENAIAEPPAMSPTGFTYGELRYQNWKAINELLAEAEIRDTEYMAAVGAAIRNGKPPPKRSNGWITADTENASSGLSDLHSPMAESVEKPSGSAIDDPDVRDKILRLRARLE